MADSGNQFGLITPRVDAVWVTPEQMQMLFRASNGNVLAQCKKNAFSMEMALCCTICKEKYAINAVTQINPANMIGGPMTAFLEAHKHQIVVDTVLPSVRQKTNIDPVIRRIKESNGN